MSFEKRKGIFLDNESEKWKDIEILTKIEKRHFRKGEFFMQSFSLYDLIFEKDYKFTDVKVLMILLRRLDFNNRIKTFRQTDIAKEIKGNQSNVSRSMKRLEQDGIIKKDGNDWYFSDKYIKGASDKNYKK